MKKQTITIGGNRLGSGEKMKTKLNAYDRSTHNLSTKVATSMGVGTLVPISVFPAMRGDSFDITLNADCRTIPTKGALFGSYKLQVDVFQCPIRLYQAILHNNPLAIGLKMNQVKFPLINVAAKATKYNYKEKAKMSNTSLLKYLGISGIGYWETTEATSRSRDFNAIPILAYYDIYKTYYANKQEEQGYYIGVDTYTSDASTITKIYYAQETEHHSNYGEAEAGDDILLRATDTYSNIITLNVTGQKLSLENIELQLTVDDNDVFVDTLDNLQDEGYVTAYIYPEATMANIEVKLPDISAIGDNTYISVIESSGKVTETMKVKEFDLKNIDDMRYTLLSQHTLGTPYYINAFGYEPYYDLCELTSTDENPNTFPLMGLALKTYQNDIYNNWLNTDWLEGDNSISDLTNVEVVDGSFSMDALNFAQKLYNMLNRIVLAGNTYEDWQDVVYEEVKRRQIESPIFCGGLSKEIMFDEVLQTTPTSETPLGTIGGRGRFVDDYQKGGKLHIKCDEACFIMVIASLTPRIFYTQGNEFFMTDLFSMDDLHKPALDGIGFQDLIAEQMDWTSTWVKSDSISRTRVGKLPAWINYMTNTDKAYGDFAEGDKAYMILNRNYTGSDYTTYIDPGKYNYAFADASLTAQNFWMLFNIGIKARRLMSARIIPNV